MRDEYLNTQDRPTFQILLITVFGFLVASGPNPAPRRSPPFPPAPGDPAGPSVHPSWASGNIQTFVLWWRAQPLSKETPERAES